MRLVALCSIAFLAQGAEEIPLWSGGAPGSEGATGKEIITERSKDPAVHDRHATNIHNPSITVFLPSPEKATGAAVIICPGGGHRLLAMDHEGYDVAKWFNSIGVAGFVLKYRLARAEGSPYKVEHAVGDAQRAFRLVRSRASEWKVDPARIGIMGFSAGAEVSARAAARFDTGNSGAADAIERQGARPDFVILFYPGFPADLAGIKVTKETPPGFLLHADNDHHSSATSAAFYQAMKAAGVSCELHIYAKGGHGFGIRKGADPVASWPLRLADWMTSLGLLKKP